MLEVLRARLERELDARLSPEERARVSIKPTVALGRVTSYSELQVYVDGAYAADYTFYPAKGSVAKAEVVLYGFSVNGDLQRRWTLPL